MGRGAAPQSETLGRTPCPRAPPLSEGSALGRGRRSPSAWIWAWLPSRMRRTRSVAADSGVTSPLSLQVVLMTLTLFPVRLLLVVAMMLLAWPFTFFASLWSADGDPEQPPAAWRK